MPLDKKLSKGGKKELGKKNGKSGVKVTSLEPRLHGLGSPERTIKPNIKASGRSGTLHGLSHGPVGTISTTTVVKQPSVGLKPSTCTVVSVTSDTPQPMCVQVPPCLIEELSIY